VLVTKESSLQPGVSRNVYSTGLTLPPPGVEVLLLIVVLAAAVYDVRYRRIPNWISVGGALLGLLSNSLMHHTAGLMFALAGLVLGFGLYFLLYLIRAMGAGDVKLMGAIGALVGWKAWVAVFVITAILGGIMAMILIILRKRVKKTFWNVAFLLNEMRHGRAAYATHEELDVHSPKAVGLPHGAVIAVSTIFYLALAAHYMR
jgi:prepilin peptidase CpaA